MVDVGLSDDCGGGGDGGAEAHPDAREARAVDIPDIPSREAQPSSCGSAASSDPDPIVVVMVVVLVNGGGDGGW